MKYSEPRVVVRLTGTDLRDWQWGQVIQCLAGSRFAAIAQRSKRTIAAEKSYQ